MCGRILVRAGARLKAATRSRGGGAAHTSGDEGVAATSSE